MSFKLVTEVVAGELATTVRMAKEYTITLTSTYRHSLCIGDYMLRRHTQALIFKQFAEQKLYLSESVKNAQ